MIYLFQCHKVIHFFVRFGIPENSDEIVSLASLSKTFSMMIARGSLKLWDYNFRAISDKGSFAPFQPHIMGKCLASPYECLVAIAQASGSRSLLTIHSGGLITHRVSARNPCSSRRRYFTPTQLHVTAIIRSPSIRKLEFRRVPMIRYIYILAIQSPCSHSHTCHFQRDVSIIRLSLQGCNGPMIDFSARANMPPYSPFFSETFHHGVGSRTWVHRFKITYRQSSPSFQGLHREVSPTLPLLPPAVEGYFIL